MGSNPTALTDVRTRREVVPAPRLEEFNITLIIHGKYRLKHRTIRANSVPRGDPLHDTWLEGTRLAHGDVNAEKAVSVLQREDTDPATRRYGISG
ncbi:hypothetical protein NM688_g8697 [Phlebia brevispora]|uniref:Uncharacterized protein n=1 Tax=Phlebia brevispora TaxID=194682 RepID=A0ACC1RQQ4_9APHY|nr:hypothetical protein NM688_g8697 [Phlebia brevispora]